MDAAIRCPGSAAPEIAHVRFRLGMGTNPAGVAGAIGSKSGIQLNIVQNSAEDVGPKRSCGTDGARARTGPWTRTFAFWPGPGIRSLSELRAGRRGTCKNPTLTGSLYGKQLTETILHLSLPLDL